MPSSFPGIGENSLNKPGSSVVEQFSQLHWYSPTRVQFKEMHGIVGCPAKNVKTLVITDEEELARKLVFVLSYFIRCSQVFEREMKFLDTDFHSIKYRINKNDVPKKTEQEEVTTSKVLIMSKSSSSPSLEPKNTKNQSMKKSKSFICSLSEMENQAHETYSHSPNEKVNFLIGENENLNINSEVGGECLDSSQLDECQSSMDSEMRSLHIDDPGVIITKGVSVSMTTEEAVPEDCINITEVPLIPFEVTSSSPAPLPSLICCNDQYMPGSVLQVHKTKLFNSIHLSISGLLQSRRELEGVPAIRSASHSQQSYCEWWCK